MNKILSLIFLIFLLVPNQINAAIILVESGGCSLADAIRSANADAPRGDCTAGSGADTIITPDNWFVTIDSTLPTIDTDINIRTITPSGLLQISGDDKHRIMRISGNNTEVTLTRVKLFRGNRPSAISNGGGAIRITDASVTLNDCEISDNFGIAVNGAGIYIDDGYLEINNSRFFANILDFGESPFETHGAGLYAIDSEVYINDSWFFRNLYSINIPGGSSMYIERGSLNMQRTLIDEEQDGVLADDADVTIENSTFSRSSINQTAFNSELLHVRNNTQLRMNHVTLDSSQGFWAIDSTLDITNSILGECNDNGSTWLRNDGNLRFNFQNTCNGEGNTQIHLQSLADNGGPTFTNALGFQSVAINSGDEAHCLAIDQRGEARGEFCDVGAYEVTDIADIEIDLQTVTSLPFGTGQQVQMNLIITNNGPGLATLFNLDIIASGLFNINTSSSICPEFPCVYPFLSSGNQIVIPIHATVSTLANNNYAINIEATSTNQSLHSDPVQDNNSDNLSGIVVASSDLEIIKTLVTSPPFFIGQSIVYDIQVNQVGGLNASNVQVTEIPENLTITGITGCNLVSGDICTINSVSTNNPANITVNATINDAIFDNTATVSADEHDPNLVNNVDEQFNGGAITSADLSVQMELLTNGPHHSDQFVQYEVVIKSGDDPAIDLVLESSYPGGIYLGIEGCDFLPCEFPAIGANSQIILTFSMFAPIMTPGFNDTITHEVILSAGQADPNLSNNISSITTNLRPAADLQTTLSLVTAPPYHVGQEIDYSLQVINVGANHAENVFISLSGIENLELLWASGQRCNELNCSIPFLEFFESEDIIFKMKITDTGDFDVAAKATSDFTDPVFSDNTDNSNNGGTASDLAGDLIFENGFED